jgi:2-methylcitrate dehydratase PrpD
VAGARTEGVAIAAGAARLLGFDAGRTATALALAGSQAAGLRENFGTMTKPFHAGRAAESGLLAASLAGKGFTTAPNILKAGRGFFSAAGGGYDPTKITDQLGDPWTFVDPGVSIKPYPSGSLTHPAMTAFLELVRAHDLRAEEVEEVRVGTNRHMPNALIHHRPTDGLEAGGIGADAGRRAVDLILDLESQPDLRTITRLLSADAVPRPGGLSQPGRQRVGHT